MAVNLRWTKLGVQKGREDRGGKFSPDITARQGSSFLLIPKIVEGNFTTMAITGGLIKDETQEDEDTYIECRNMMIMKLGKEDTAKWDFYKEITLEEGFPVWSHTAHLLERIVYFVGGHISSATNGNPRAPKDSPFIWTFDIKTEKFDFCKIDCGGMPNLLNRVEHCSTILGWNKSKSKIYIFGGRDVSSEKVLGDLVVLDLTRQTARQIFCANSPQPREKATLTAINNHLFLFGGISDLESPPLDQEALCIYSITGEAWVLKVEVELIARDPCFCHRTVYFGQKMFVYGGSHTRNTVLCLDLSKATEYSENSMCWSEIDVPEEVGSSMARRSHGLCQCGRVTYINGGFTESSSGVQLYEDAWQVTPGRGGAAQNTAAKGPAESDYSNLQSCAILAAGESDYAGESIGGFGGRSGFMGATTSGRQRQGQSPVRLLHSRSEEPLAPATRCEHNQRRRFQVSSQPHPEESLKKRQKMPNPGLSGGLSPPGNGEPQSQFRGSSMLESTEEEEAWPDSKLREEYAMLKGRNEVLNGQLEVLNGQLEAAANRDGRNEVLKGRLEAGANRAGREINKLRQDLEGAKQQGRAQAAKYKAAIEQVKELANTFKF